MTLTLNDIRLGNRAAFVRRTLCWVSASILIPLNVASGQIVQERVDVSAFSRIREEGLLRSHLDPLAHHLLDVIGPRLTGSQQLSRANEWTSAQLRAWGLSHVTVEPWGSFGRGWERVHSTARIVSPYVQELHAIPVGWSGSTAGSMRARVVVVHGLAELEQLSGRLKGAVILLDTPAYALKTIAREIPRIPMDSLFDPHGGRHVASVNWDSWVAGVRDAHARRQALLRAAGVAGVLGRSGAPYGLIRGNGIWSAFDPSQPMPLPELVVSQEQYNQMYRNVEAGTEVWAEIDVQNRFVADDLKAYNVLADIPGTDKADEYVMIGAHLDSWHYGTGATDDGAGVLVMLEAMRILKTVGLSPRRTIRVALWSGEEQGLLGSRGWISNHRDLLGKVSAYLNVDNGSGKIRGIWDQSNDRAAAIFEQMLWPFRDLGVVAVRHGDDGPGASDHNSFDNLGVPAFTFIQDPLDYMSWTHHSELDTYDHVSIDDLRQAAVVVAATAYHLAMRDSMMPRKVASPVSGVGMEN